jgi:peptidoglycan/xylan/chitin deacetylase (PgdA/CDA1 family)
VRVALTFDAEHPDRPHCPPEAPARILDILAEEGVAATFFLQGRWARAYPELARRIPGEGHLVGCHSFFHARLPLLSDEGLAFDIAEAERWIRETAGVDPRPLFRLPWGDGARDPRVTSALEGAGYRHAGWDVVAEDWEETRTARQVERDVIGGAVAAGDGAVVLMHTWPASTVEALPPILDGLRDGGAAFVTVAELDDRDLARTADPPDAASNPGGRSSNGDAGA